MNMPSLPDVIVEEFPSKVAASFDTQEAAERAAAQIAEAENIEDRQVRTIEPDDSAVARKLQPESQSIQRTWMRTHIAFGAFGLLLGSLLAAIAVQWGPVALTASPMFTGITLVWVSTLSCLMVAGAATLRMDHDLILNHVSAASAKGQHTVIAHARTAREKRRFARQLRRRAETTVSSL